MMIDTGLSYRLRALPLALALALGFTVPAAAQCPEHQRLRGPIPGVSVGAGVSVGTSSGVGTGRSDIEAASGGGTGAYGGVGMSSGRVAGREPQLSGAMTVDNCAAYLGDVAGYTRARTADGMIAQIEDLLNQTAPPVPDDQRQCAHTILDHMDDASKSERQRVTGVYRGPGCK